MICLNPFKPLFETRRIYPSTLKQRLWDTFCVFSGDLTFNLGIFDYLTLGIHYFIWCKFEDLLKIYSSFFKKKLVTLLFTVPIQFIIFLPRFFFAVTGVLLVLPIILLVHLCSYLMFIPTKRAIEKEAFQVKVLQSSNIISLRDALKKNNTQTIKDSKLVATNTPNGLAYTLELREKNRHSLFATIHIITPQCARYVRQLAKVDFADIGQHFDFFMFNDYVRNVEQGLFPWNHEAAINGYTCLMLLKLETKASRKSLPLALLFQIATFLVPENLDIANEIGLMKTKANAPFFLMKRALRIVNETHPSKAQISI